MFELRKYNRCAVQLIACWPGAKPDELLLHDRFKKHALESEWFAPAEEVKSWIAGIGRHA